MTAATKEPTVPNYDPDFHVNECARAARAAHARMMRGDIATLHVYYRPRQIEAFAEGEVPHGEGWVQAWSEHAPTDRTADQLVAWLTTRAGSVPYLIAPSPEPRLTLEWGGWPVPATAPIAWGARAIYTYNRHAHGVNRTARGTTRKRRVMDYFTIDLLCDRQSTARDPAQTTDADAVALGTWINKTGLPELRKLCNDRFIAGDSAEEVTLERDGYALKAGPRASHGYLYIVVWKVAP